MPHLFGLKNNFTSFQVHAALDLSSKHAKRSYQICSQWKDVGQTRKVAILDLKKTLGLADDKGNEEYNILAMFEKKVLDVAVRQINEKTDLRVSIHPFNDGKQRPHDPPLDELRAALF